jgi:hypothetical protein
LHGYGRLSSEVGWVERSDTHPLRSCRLNLLPVPGSGFSMGIACGSTHPTCCEFLIRRVAKYCVKAVGEREGVSFGRKVGRIGDANPA